MVERWHLTHAGLEHQVDIADAGWGKRLGWSVDGEQVAQRRTGESRVVLVSDRYGAIGVRLPELVGPARRVTWYAPRDDGTPPEAVAHAGLGGIDLDPEPGSAAARREEWIRAHPRRYAVRRTLAAAAGVAVPLLLVWLLSRLVLPQLPWPDWELPSIPWPSIPWPAIPWPSIDWPSIPWPHWSLPAWVDRVRAVLPYVAPAVVALVLARREVTRRRTQDHRKAQAESTSRTAARPAATSAKEVESGESPTRRPSGSR